MNIIKSYKQFVSTENQNVMRERLSNLMVKNKISLEVLSKKINITVVTLRRFLIDEKDASFETLCNIAELIEKIESDEKQKS